LRSKTALRLVRFVGSLPRLRILGVHAVVRIGRTRWLERTPYRTISQNIEHNSQEP